MDTTRIIFIILCMVKCIQCYGTGPPVSSKPEICDTMTPGHYGLQPQTGASPFSITVPNGVTSYKPGTPISVSIGGADFKGMFLQARKVNTNEIVGKFSSPPANTQLLTCGQISDNAVGHANTNPKNNLVFTWSPPSHDAGQVEFVATIAQEKMTVWIKQKSTTQLTFEDGVDNPPEQKCENDFPTGGLAVIAKLNEKVAALEADLKMMDESCCKK